MRTQSNSDLSTAVRNYALALLIFAVAIGARYLLDYVVPERLPFITFFPAVLVAAFFCGLWPSILVLVLSAAAGAAWTEAPAGASEIVFFVASFLLFIGLSGVNVALVHILMTTLEKLRQRDQQLGLINLPSSSTASRTCSRSPTRCACKPSSPAKRSTTCPTRSAGG